MTERTVVIQSLRDDDYDTVSLVSTQESDVDLERDYAIEKILAEQDDDEGNKFYLIKWEGYVLIASTWEPAKNIPHQAICDLWEDEKTRIEQGRSKSFDVANFERELSKAQSAKADRRRRRKAKRHQLGIAVSPFGSGSEPDLALDRIDSDSSVNTGGIEDSSEDEPALLGRPRRPKQMRMKNQSQPAQKDGSNTKESESIDNRSMRMRGDKHKQSDRTDSSDDSLIEELKQKSQKNRRKLRSRTAIQKNTAKVKPVRNSVSDEIEDSFRVVAPTTTANQKEMQPKHTSNAEPPSRTGYQGTGRKTLAASSLGCISTSVPDSSRGRGRGNSSGTVLGFTRKNSAPDTALKQKRTLGNAILNAPKPDPKKPTDHFKTPSMVRKAELASRGLADRAPDMASIGRLTKPSDYSGIRPARKTPAESNSIWSRRHSDVGTGNESANKHNDPDELSFTSLETRIDDDQLIPHEESNDTSTITKSKGKGKDDAEKDLVPEESNLVETFQGRSNGLPQASGRNPKTATDAKITNKDVPDGCPVDSRATMPKLNKELAIQGEDSNFNDILLSTTINQVRELVDVGLQKPKVAFSPLNTETPYIPPQNEAESKAVKKINLKDYGSRRKPELLGTTLPIRIIFGNNGMTPVSVYLTNIDNNSAQSWANILIKLEIISFNQLCLAQDFEAQNKFLRGRVLASGSIVVDDSNGSKIVEEAVECLRPLSGLIFTHSAFNVIIYPAKCEEWKFLDTDTVGGQSSTLLYQVYESLLDVRGWSDIAAREDFTSSVDLKRSYLESLVACTHGLKYDVLVSSVLGGQDNHNFYLLFPHSAASIAAFIASWLRACDPKCRVFTPQKTGSWDFFANSTTIKAGAVIIHTSLVMSIFKIPYLKKRIFGKYRFDFWCVDETTLLMHLDWDFSPKYGASSAISGMVRLLPHGGAIFLTPSFLISHPQRTYELLKWFHKRLQNAVPGSWKIVVAFDCRQYLLDLAIKKASERAELLSSSTAASDEVERMATIKGLSHRECELRFVNYNLVDELLRDENMAGFPCSWDGNNPNEIESPVIYALENIDADDEKTLVSWFAGWTLLHLHLFRRLVVLGTTPSGPGTSSPIKDGGIYGISSRRESVNLIPAESEIAKPKSHLKSNNNVTEGMPSQGPIIEGLHANSIIATDPSVSTSTQPLITASELSATEIQTASTITHNRETLTREIDSSEKQSSPHEWLNDVLQRSIASPISQSAGLKHSENGLKGSHGIREGTDSAVLQSKAVSGADKHTAESYLKMCNNDPALVAQNNVLAASSSIEAKSMPQVEVASNKVAILGFIVRTHATHSDARHYLHEARQDVGLAIALYNEAQKNSSKKQLNLDEASDEEGQDVSKRPTTFGIASDENDARQSAPNSARSSASGRPHIGSQPGYVPLKSKAGHRIGAVGGHFTPSRIGDSADRGLATAGGESGDRRPPLSKESTTNLRTVAAVTKNKETDGFLQPETTVEWYENLGHRWEHIWVCGWEDCFPILKVKTE